MSLSFNGLSGASVVLSGTVTTDVTKRTATVIAGTTTGATDVTLGTVGVGKVWRVLCAWIAGGVEDTTTTGATINLNGVAVVGTTLTAPTGNASASANSVSFDYSACPVLTSGQTVVLNSNGAGMDTTYGGITYVEENA